MDGYIENNTLTLIGRIPARSLRIFWNGDAGVINKFLDACETNGEFCAYYLEDRRVWFPKIIEAFYYALDNVSLKLFQILLDISVPKVAKIICEIICSPYPRWYFRFSWQDKSMDSRISLDSSVKQMLIAAGFTVSKTNANSTRRFTWVPDAEKM